MNKNIIIKTPGTCGGRPRIKGHRVTVDDIIGLMNEGADIDEIFKTYEDISKKDIIEAVNYHKAQEFLKENSFADAYELKEVLNQVEHIIRYDKVMENSYKDNKHRQHNNSIQHGLLECYKRFKKYFYEEDYPVCSNQMSFEFLEKTLKLDIEVIKEHLSILDKDSLTYIEISEAIETYNEIIKDPHAYYLKHDDYYRKEEQSKNK